MIEEERKRAENNIRLGRMFYQCQTDAAGYPNGMPYWPEFSAQEKYYCCMQAIQFFEMLVQNGFADSKIDFGLGEHAVWGKGDCKILMDLLEENLQSERDEFAVRIKVFQNKDDSDR